MTFPGGASWINLSSRRELLLLLAACPAAASRQIHGRWAATVQGQTLGGSWTAQPYDEPDAAYGNWSLLDQAGRRLVYGTWSARKAKDKWEGRWQAEVEQGRKHVGTWTASVDRSGNSHLMDLFRLALSRTVGGTWESDSRLSGAWSIETAR